MRDLQEKIQAVQSWLDEIRQERLANPSDVPSRETILGQMLELIERNVYSELEVHLQNHIASQSKLIQRLEEQIAEQKRTQVGKQEEQALSEALRDTLATMSSTVDLDKILDHILDTVKRVTPYDGANSLFVESDLVHVVR
jgi:type II secretory pathway predicted ATPase ExeA